MLLDHTEDTFVTPVFNGSASLRDAAGQLIENVTKSVRRKETIDEPYLERMFSDTISLYHLDSLSVGQNGSAPEKLSLGKLPTGSVILLAALLTVWLLIGVIYLIKTVRSRNKK